MEYNRLPYKATVYILKEKNKAKEDFDDAIAGGHGAYMAEQSEFMNIFF